MRRKGFRNSDDLLELVLVKLILFGLAKTPIPSLLGVDIFITAVQKCISNSLEVQLPLNVVMLDVTVSTDVT